MTTAAAMWWAALLAPAACGGWALAQRRGAARRRARTLTAAPAVGGGAAPGTGPGGPAALLRSWRPPRWAVPELALLPAGLLLGLPLRSPVPALAATAALLPLRRCRLAWRSRREQRQRESAVIELCTVLAGELRAGAVPAAALESAVTPGRPTAELLRRAGVDTTALLAAARLGGDVPQTLRRAAALPGAAGAAAVAACWQVAADSGAGLADGLDRVADALRADSALREAVSGELAGPRTTAVLLAALPAFGLLLGTALGADPLRMLLHTPAGLGCLVTGVLLEAAGLVWTARIVRAAEGVGPL